MKKEVHTVTAWCKDGVKDHPVWMMRPMFHTKEMRDCVMDWYGGYMFGWQDFREFPLDSNMIKSGTTIA